MNGQENSSEIFEGATTAEFWEYDSRLGRRWNVDPVVRSWESPYACFSNNPIFYSDPSGAEGEPPPAGTIQSCEDGTSEIMGTNGQWTTMPEFNSPEISVFGEDLSFHGSMRDITIVEGAGPSKAKIAEAILAGNENIVSSSFLFGYGHINPGDYSSDVNLNRAFATGQLMGATVVIKMATAEAATGEGMVEGGLLATPETGPFGAGTAFIGGAMALHGSSAIGYATASSIAATTYLTATSTQNGNGNSEINSSNSEDLGKSSGKNEKHGDGGRKLSKVEKQLEDLQEKLKTATGNEKKKIIQKIKNIRETAQKAKKGEEHSRGVKR